MLRQRLVSNFFHSPSSPSQPPKAKQFKEELPEEFPQEDLYKYTGAHGFNIEGGKPFKAVRENAICVNMVFVLDKSVENVNYADLEAKCKKYNLPLNEMAIENYNEYKVNLFTLATLLTYLNEGHDLAHKSKEDPLQLVIHTHRGERGIYTNQLLANMIIDGLSLDNTLDYAIDAKKVINKKGEEVKDIELLKLNNLNIDIHFRRGYTKPLTDKIYKEADILINYSMGGGLSYLESGSILAPKKFMRLDAKKSELLYDQKYKVNNHLFVELPKILALTQQQKYIDLIKQKFGSKLEEKNKTMVLEPLKEADVHKTMILELTGIELFHPAKTEPPTLVKVVRNSLEEVVAPAINDRASLCFGS